MPRARSAESAEIVKRVQGGQQRHQQQPQRQLGKEQSLQRLGSDFSGSSEICSSFGQPCKLKRLRRQRPQQLLQHLRELDTFLLITPPCGRSLRPWRPGCLWQACCRQWRMPDSFTSTWSFRCL
mmetsp:Transcript_116878/g.342259  ORF Transcript_116878/g.342259 Transcript_116878/m.342259 type:complete len:124 (-) Transcript_116878:594-965(-)